ncbi:MAG: hypothetical protein Q4G50_04100 [Corynebacterium sp.]|uniref:hypothetical protein n=1 Tax=Corynebacterium sp. TaxID=1720 RepID=UPI0026DFFC9C|nr:hypothetical protein [Corynebacterium sp.]MDO5669164.1 hypothetical protein [Corynebacterium sp.]
MSVAATAKASALGWELVNHVAVDACRQLAYDNPSHLDGVRILGWMSTCGSTPNTPDSHRRLWAFPDSECVDPGL